MQYAKSLLLQGQLIEATDADPNTYQDLLCVCPTSGGKVFLDNPGIYDGSGGQPFYTGARWVHCTEPDEPSRNKCILNNDYGKEEIKDQNLVACQERLEIFRPHLWELIVSSAFLTQPVTFEGYDDFQKDGLMRWLTEKLLVMCRQQEFQAGIKKECQNLYERGIKNALENGNNYLSDKVHKIFADGNHRVYGQQIAGEVLEFALKSLEPDKLQKLIYLGIDSNVSEAIHKFAHVMSTILACIFDDNDFANFENLWTQDKCAAMEHIEAIAKKYPNLKKPFMSGFADVIRVFIINLGLIFSCVLWLEELKKFNQK